MNDVALEIQNLVIGYPGRPLTAPISLRVPTGSRLGIIGGNGVGKTTLMKTILGLVAPVQGKARWNPKANFGYVPQENQVDMLFPLTVTDLLKMGFAGRLPRFRRSTPAMNRDFDAVLSEMEILPLKRALVREISGGERQRALIARAWVSRPKAMLMDEPFNSLDHRFKEKLWGIFSAWQQSHELTLLLIDHDLNRLIHQVDRLIVLGPHGTLCGTTAEILQPEWLSQVYGAPVHVHQENGIPQVHFL